MAAVMPVTLVLFDMDDVLVEYSRDARVAHLAGLSGRAPASIHAAIFASGFEAEGDSGAIDAEAYLRGFGERIGYALTLNEWIDARRAGTRARPAMLDLVRRLRVRSAVLTNNSELVSRHIDRICPELAPLFGDRFHASAAFRAAKPQAEVFHRCLAALGAEPGETLFTDDLPENVGGAEAAGLQGHRFVSVGRLEAALSERRLLEPSRIRSA